MSPAARRRTRPAPAQSPLWRREKCGHRFVTRNLWHSCGRYRLADHFAGKDPWLRRLFDTYVAFVRRCGPFIVYAQKTRIVFQVRVRFAGDVVRTRWIEAGFYLTRRIEDPRFHRIDTITPRGHAHYLRLTDASQLDRGLAAIVREAYAVGCQQHLRGPDPRP